MPIDIATRRKTDGERQLANLIAELDTWKEAANRALKQHNSQINAAHRTLSVLLAKLKANNPPIPPEKYARLVLSAHRIWDFFQSKFAQRQLLGARVFLEIADQMAYDCYRVVGDYVKKAPPLVILSGASQPYVQKRDTPFAVEGVATQETLVDVAASATANLPFPVIGVPWFQTAQLEGLVAIGHEVGHAVEDDLELTKRLQEIFKASVASDRRENWVRWQRELFADIWGCLSTGPAFVYGLADHLAPAKPWKEPIDATSVYPPAWLRIRFSRAVIVHQMGQAKDQKGQPQPFPAGVKEALEDWCALYPVYDAAAGHLDDFAGVISALFSERYPGVGKLGTVLTFTPENHGSAVALAEKLLRLDAGEGETRMRIAAAAVRLAYEAEPEPSLAGTTKRLAALKKASNPGLRAAVAPADLQNADAQRAQKLFALLSSG